MDSLRRLTSSVFDAGGRAKRAATTADGGGAGGAGDGDGRVLSPTSAAAIASELDLTYLTEQLVAIGAPVLGPTDKKRHENNAEDLAAYLDARHGGQFLVFNLNALDSDASGAGDDPQHTTTTIEAFLDPQGDSTTTTATTTAIAARLHEQVLEFGWERDGMKAHTPPLDLIFRLCYAIFAWLALDPAHVALVHCQTGKTRSGIVVACYLLYARLADDPLEAFVEFYRRRWDMASLTAGALREKTPPSIQRFLTGFHTLVEHQRAPNERPLLLKAIIIRALPVDVRPCLQIWDDYRQVFCTSDASTGPDAHSTVAPVVDWNADDGFLAILWESALELDGGFSILCSFGDAYDDDDSVDASSRVLFRYADSTWFLAPGLITLNKSHLDMMKQYEHGFDEEQFSMDLVLHDSSKPRRRYVPIDLTGNRAVRQGVEEITKHHLVLPDPAMHSNFIKMGFSDAATTFALQRSQNAPNVALDLLHSDGLAACFPISKMEDPSEDSHVDTTQVPAQRRQQAGEASHHQPPPLVKRQSTAEIVALQSQRSRYSIPTAVDSSICAVCKDDDYMMRPQVVRCNGNCRNFYHTTCVGLKRIPFGLTTLSDRTNHAVYVKKYFSAWECDHCAPSQAGQPGATPTLTVLPHLHDQPSSRPTSVSTSKSGLPPTTTAHSQSSSQHALPTDQQPDDSMYKLKQFLAMSGVSVEDLLRAATTANVTISTSAALALPGPQQSHSPGLSPTPTPATEHNGSEKGSGTSPSKVLQKLFSSPSTQASQAVPKSTQGTAGDSSADASAAPSSPTSTSPTTELMTSGVIEKVNRPQAMDPKSALLAQIAARGKLGKEERGNDGGSTEAVPFEPAAITKPSEAIESIDPLDRYNTMLKRGVPFEAVQSCMKKEGVDPKKLTPLEIPVAPPNVVEPTVNGIKLKDVEEFSRYFAMVRLGCPRDAVRQKMVMDGVDSTVIDLSPETPFEEVKDKIQLSEVKRTTLEDDIKSVKSHKPTSNDGINAVKSTSTIDTTSPVQTDTNDTKLKEHEVYSKYFKMLRMGLPEGAVRHKMRTDGVDERAIELGEDANVSRLIEIAEGPRLADDPTYAKYFKMLKMGLPEGAVRHKIVSDGADPRVLDLGPDGRASQLQDCKKDEKKVTKPVKRGRKKLHWQPISEDRLSSINQQTIWEDKDDDITIEVDVDELESLFFSNNDTKKKTSTQGKVLKRKQTVTLIDAKRAMNAAILLARVKLSYAEIANAIQGFDATGLTLQQLMGIREFLPTADEVFAVSRYSGDFAMLGEAEKFIKEISTVKRYVSRTECLLFKLSFPAQRDELKDSLLHVTSACDEVKGSRLLKILLGMVLKLGNTLNGSGQENEIRGFTVDSLLRLGHTKAVNQKTTVLHYLVRLVKKNHPAALDFQVELKSIPHAARVSFEIIDDDHNRLKAGLTQLSEEFQEMQKDLSNENCDGTIASLQSVVEDIGAQLEELELTIQQARDNVRGVFDYFGEDPKKSPSEFFTTLSSFCAAFDVARKEVDAADEAMLRAERLKMRRNSSVRPPPSLTARRDLGRDRAMSERFGESRGFKDEA